MRDLLQPPRPRYFAPHEWVIVTLGVAITLAWVVGGAWFLAAVLQ